MLKNMFATLIAAALVAVPALAGDGHNHDHAGHGDAKQETMMKMMTEMSNCNVCSIMMPHMQTMGPSMSMEVVTLNNGMALLHSVGAEHVALLHEIGDKMHAAGEKVMTMDAKEAEGALCSHCMQIHELMAAGAKMSHGKTATGDIMTFTSDDMAVQKKIAAVEEEWRKMNEMMQG